MPATDNSISHRAQVLDDQIEKMKHRLEKETDLSKRKFILLEIITWMNIRKSTCQNHPKKVSSIQRSDASYYEEHEKLFLELMHRKAEGCKRKAENDPTNTRQHLAMVRLIERCIETHIEKYASFKSKR